MGECFPFCRALVFPSAGPFLADFTGMVPWPSLSGLPGENATRVRVKGGKESQQMNETSWSRVAFLGLEGSGQAQPLGWDSVEQVGPSEEPPLCVGKTLVHPESLMRAPGLKGSLPRSEADFVNLQCGHGVYTGLPTTLAQNSASPLFMSLISFYLNAMLQRGDDQVDGWTPTNSLSTSHA